MITPKYVCNIVLQHLLWFERNVFPPVYTTLSTISGSDVLFKPDTLRLLIVFAFIYGAILDYRTRRVYNEFWGPLIGLCFIVLGWDVALLAVSSSTIQTEFLFSLSLSVLVAPSLAYLMWQQGIFGGADLKAIAFLAVFFPKVPEFTVNGATYPFVDGISPVFTVTVLVNAIIISGLYRFYLLGRNLSKTEISGLMTRASKYETNEIDGMHGDIIVETGSQTKSLVDIDIIRMYLQWRNTTLSELRSNRDFYQTTLPVVTNDIGDGSVYHASETPLGRSRAEFRQPPTETSASIIPIRQTASGAEHSDRWAVDEFLEEADLPNMCRLTGEELRTALDKLSEQDSLWVSPSLPFFIPLTIGLVIALGYGSLFIGATDFAAEIIVQLIT